jgi:hypothetical protein
MTGDHFAGLIWESLERPRLTVHKTPQDAWGAHAIEENRTATTSSTKRKETKTPYHISLV